MQITIAKQDLEAALNITSHALGREDWTTHYFVRRHSDTKIECLSTNHRYCSSAIATCTLDGEELEFTMEGSRAKTWLRNVTDGVALVLNSDGNVVKAKSARGSVRWACVDSKTFPYWDAALKQAKSQCTISAENLCGVLNHTKHFIGKIDAKTLAFRYITVNNGGVLASNGLSMTLVICPDLQNASFYLTANDLPPLMGYLSKLEGDVEILATDRIVFFKGSNEAIFGLTLPSKRATAGLGGLSPIAYEKTLSTSMGSWEVTSKDLVQSIGLLESSMEQNDQTIKLSFEDGDEPSLLISAKSVAGDVDSLSVGLQSHSEDKQGVMRGGQYLNKEVVLKTLGLLDTSTIKMMILEKLHGSPCAEHEVAGNLAYSVIVPLQNKNF